MKTKTAFITALLALSAHSAQAKLHCKAIDPTGEAPAFNVDITLGELVKNDYPTSYYQGTVKFTGPKLNQTYSTVFATQSSSTRCYTQDTSTAKIGTVAKIFLSTLTQHSNCGPQNQILNSIVMSPEGWQPEKYQLVCQKTSANY